MILGLVLSKDRALQLDACLASFFRHAQDASNVELVVLYRGSSRRFLGQYEELARFYAGKARFLPESNFRSQVLEILASAAGTGTRAQRQSILGRLRDSIVPEAAAPEQPADLVLFLVDDTLFVSPLGLASVQSSMEENPGALGFSLRLGANTTYCYVLDRQQQLPAFERTGQGFLKYNWTTADGDFAYPLEISSSLYRLPMLRRLLSGLRFTSPNTLEGQLARRARPFSRRSPLMLCPARSIAFSAPVNRVQEVFENRSGSDPRWSTGQLAEKFDEGLRIDVARFDDFTSSACHQEVELSFESRS